MANFMADLDRISERPLWSQPEVLHSELDARGSPRPRSPHVFALIIGINQYSHKCRHFPPLSGAVADADSVSRFLIQDRGVDPSHITNLRDGRATRSKIVDSLEALANDTRINFGDTIIIYFAGHTRGPNKGCSSEENPTALWTVDSLLDDPEPGLTGEVIYHLLHAVSRSKGKNVVLVLDTCHSGHFSPVNVRRTTLKQKEGEEPYVLLAACRDLESTSEYHGRGLFTQTMLKFLMNYNPATYDDLFKKIWKEYKDRGLRIKPGYYGWSPIIVE